MSSKCAKKAQDRSHRDLLYVGKWINYGPTPLWST